MKRIPEKYTRFLMLVVLFCAMHDLLTACGKDMPTGPVVNTRQIIGPCWVSKTIVKIINGAQYTEIASAHYEVCPPIAEVEALGEVETVNHP